MADPDTVGEVDAGFAPLFERFFPALVGFFRNRGESPPDSEDLAQETLYRALRSLPRFTGQSSLATWIFIIAGNLWRNHRRDQSYKAWGGTSISLDSPEGAAIAVSASREESSRGIDFLVTAQLGELLEEKIAELPPKMQRVVRMKLKGHDYSEIARACGIEVGTAKSLFFQATRKLRDAFSVAHPEFFNAKSGLG